MARQEGVGDPRSRYYDYLNYTSYYAFLEELEAQMASEPETVVARLQNVQSFFTNRSGAVATFSMRILFRQNSSWQGSLTWIEGNQEEYFRSVLELIVLMENALRYATGAQ